MKKQMNVTIDDGKTFFANEVSINFNPLQFTLDYKNITPRVDVRSKEAPSIHIEHNVVVLDPFHAKMILELMVKVVKEYEKEFGVIKKPKALEKLHKKHAKKNDIKTPKKTVTAPTYFG